MKLRKLLIFTVKDVVEGIKKQQRKWAEEQIAESKDPKLQLKPNATPEER